MMEMYLKIDPSGELSWIELERCARHDDIYCGAEALSIFDLYSVIGCSCVEPVRTVLPNIVIMVDESGRIKSPPKPHNELASRLYAGWLLGRDNIVGTAVVFALRPTEPIGELDLFPLTPAEESLLSLSLGAVLPDKS